MLMLNRGEVYGFVGWITSWVFFGNFWLDSPAGL
jgi:hypothetical protein